MFLNSMFQQMFTGVGQGPFSGGPGASIWRSFLTDEYSKSFVKAGGIGIADQVHARAAGAAGGPMSNVWPQTQKLPPRPVASAAEAELLIKHLLDVMDALLGTVEEETALVRAGKLAEAAKLEPTKTELSRHVYRRHGADPGQPGLSRPGHAGHGRRSCASGTTCSARVLQMNLTVLATAHAVSESIMRGVSTELARKATPQAYGASGRATAPAAAAGNR